MAKSLLFVVTATSKANQGKQIANNMISGYKDLNQNILQTINLISELMGKDITIISDPLRLRPLKSEVERLCADNKKAKTLLGWKPEYTGIEGLKIGLSETIKWFADPKNLSLYKSDSYNI